MNYNPQDYRDFYHNIEVARQLDYEQAASKATFEGEAAPIGPSSAVELSLNDKAMPSWDDMDGMRANFAAGLDAARQADCTGGPVAPLPLPVERFGIYANQSPQRS
jgi:hypothetical protein